MGLGTNQTTITVADKWIPEIWQDEAVATYMGKTVMANLVTKMNHKGKKGDTFHIPNPARGEASVKATNTQVTLISDTAAEILIYINKHYEYSKMYEDMADIQALNGMRPFYTKDAGYAMAKRIDRELWKASAGLQGGTFATATALFEKGVIGGDGTTTFQGSANTNTGNGTALTDAAIRTAIQMLEDQDVETSECALILPPVEIKVLRGISRFTEQAFVGDGNAIKTGHVSSLYGIDVYASSQCPWVHVNSVTGTQSVTFNSTTPTGASFVDDFGLTVDWNTTSPTNTKYRVGALLHKDALVLVEQSGVRTQQQYKQEYLGYLVTSDAVFGTGELRDYAGLNIIFPS